MTSVCDIKSIVAGALLVAAAAGCAGQDVEPIDIHNAVISGESRRFVADAQDAVSIAQSGVNEARGQLNIARERRDELLDAPAWQEVSRSVVDKFETLLDARVKLAELNLERAHADVELAEQKLTEVYAETAVRHDLETYELEPIRRRVDARLDEVSDIESRIGEQLVAVDNASRAWWKSYRHLLAGQPHPDMFFLTTRQLSDER